MSVLSQPEVEETDLRHALLRADAKELVAKELEMELASVLESVADHRLAPVRPAVVRNGYLPEHTVQTGIGDVEELRFPRNVVFQG